MVQRLFRNGSSLLPWMRICASNCHVSVPGASPSDEFPQTLRTYTRLHVKHLYPATMGLLDSLPFWPSGNAPDRAPRLRRTRSWIGRQSDGSPIYAPRRNRRTGSTADVQNPTDHYITVTSDFRISEHFERVPGQFPSSSEPKTFNDVTFAPVSQTMVTTVSARKARRRPRLFSILRYRKGLRRNSSAEFAQDGEGGGDGDSSDHASDHDTDHDVDNDGRGGHGGHGRRDGHDVRGDDGDNGGAADDQGAAEYTEPQETQPPDQSDDRANENSEERKVSDQTVLSRDSNDTIVTVCRRPSKRTSRPIVTVDQEYVYESPFNEVEEASHSGTRLDPFPDPTDPRNIISHSNRPSISEYSDDYPRALGYPERPENPMFRNFPFTSRSSSRNSACHVFAKGSDWSGEFDVHKAVNAFNELAAKLNLQPLELPDDYEPTTGDQPSEEEVTECKSLRRRDRIFGRIRVMRSNLAMKVPTEPEERGLRRMKTFANFSTRTPRMASLRGKSLVTLARLGGQSLLDLPGDFAPTTLKLPVCFVTTALYLRCNAPSVRNLFFDSGDLKAAARLYDRFANQVLSAEKETGKIEMTMRSSDMPIGLNIHLGTPAKNVTEVLTVANVFKSLLAGLPGGILGSKKLYAIMVDMYYASFSDCQLKRTFSCLGGLSVVDATKVKAIAHAILALTSKMQLELICGVFGLCAVLLHETERNIELARQERGRAGSSFVLSGLMNVDRLGRVFGPLLINLATEANDSYGSIEREIESERVATMLITNWRDVSRQLRAWEHGGYMAKPVGYIVRSGGGKLSDEVTRVTRVTGGANAA